MATLNDLDWNSVCEAIASVYGTDAQTIATTLTNNGVALGDVEQAFKMLEGTSYEIWYNADGTVRSYNYVGMPETYLTKSNSAGVSQLIDSNAQVTTKTAVKVPLNTTASLTEPTKTSWKAGLNQAGNFVFKTLIPAAAATSVGITLGKTIDSALYNANPDFWDSHGWGTINPETWNSITYDDESLNARVFNAIFGIDPNTNKAQTYIDQNALAYLALLLQQKGVFSEAGQDISDVTGVVVSHVPNVVTVGTGQGFSSVARISNPQSASYTEYIVNSGNPLLTCFVYPYNSSQTNFLFFACSKEPFSITRNFYTSPPPSPISRTETVNAVSRVINGETIYLSTNESGGANNTFTVTGAPLCITDGKPTSDQINNELWGVGYAILNGTSAEAIEGIGTQSGATTPSLSNEDTVAEVLAKLQTQYPDLFNNAVTQDVVQPDGSIKTYTYVPIGVSEPNPNPTDGYSPEDQPISTNSTQANPEVDPETATEAQLQYVIGLLTEIANPNLENTGEGSTPPVVIPTGTASALYTVYNPTNAEINSFGSWLWSANFVDQLLKMFNDPMQAIISLHKVFCTPSISGRSNIKVGYLDSGVSANVVDGQYVTIDCGTVNLSEQFQNVFDYPPFTDVTLYLPFIGFVRLDTNDVMRGSVNVIYHVDVLTGACLAEVNVTRDMFGGVIYQYTGDCSVHYPLSSGSYMGMVSALLGVAGTIASGGSLAPMVIGATAKAMGGHSSVERSGNLSGNAGAMGIKKPYLVVQRPQTNLANIFETFVGKPANFTTKIGSCTGFISCTEVHIENCNGTDAELSELENLLKSGIII